MSRANAIEQIEDYFDQGLFFTDLSRRLGFRTESQVPEQLAELRRYLKEEIAAELRGMGFTLSIEENRAAGAGPILIAQRKEGSGLPTVLSYGHGEVVGASEYRPDWT